MQTRIIRLLFFAACLIFTEQKAFSAITFDWKGTTTSWTTASNWTASDGTTTKYPGSNSRTDDIVRFGVSGATYSVQPTLALTNATDSLTVGSITFGNIEYLSGFTLSGFQVTGTVLTVNTGRLTVTGSITQNVNNLTGTNGTVGSIFNVLAGSGTISCNSITIGAPNITNGRVSVLISVIANLRVQTDVNINLNVNQGNAVGFRLESGTMTIARNITFTDNNSITAQNASYFTVNARRSQLASGVANILTNPTLILNNAAAVSTIPTPNASVNFYGDHAPGGKATVIYRAASPLVYTTATLGFGSGGGVRNSNAATDAIYDNLVIQGSGTAVIAGASATGEPSILNIDSTLTTNSNATFANVSTATRIGASTSSAGLWTNASGVTITGGAGATDINGTLTNAGTMNMGTGDLAIAQDYTNTGTFTPNSSALITFDGSTAQTLTDATTNGTNFFNVTFSNGSASLVKTMKAGSKFTVAPKFTLTVNNSAVLAVGNQTSPAGNITSSALTLLSTIAGDASIADMSNGNITGSINVNRYVSGNLRRYMLLSSPVTNTTFGSTAVKAYNLKPLIATTFITGPGGSGSGFDDAPATSNSPSVFVYDENSPATTNVNLVLNNEYKPFATTSDAVPIANGILYYFRGSRSIANPFIPPFPASDNAVLNFLGTVFKGTGTTAGTNGSFTANIVNFPSTPPLTYDDAGTGMSAPATLSFGSTTSTKKGLNLIGNPYASVLDLLAFYNANKGSGTIPNFKFYYQLVKDTKTGTNSSSTKFVVYDASSTATPPTGASRFMPSGGGFFILATNTGQSITFNETMKASYALYQATLSGTNANTNPVFNVKKPGSQQVLAKSSTGGIQTSAIEKSASAVLSSASNNIQVADATPRLRLELMSDTVVHNSTDMAFANDASSKFSNGEDAPYYQPSGQGDLIYSLSADSVGCFANYTANLEKLKRINLVVTFSAFAQYKITSPFKQNIDDRYTIFLKDNYTNDSLDVVHNNVYTFNVDKNKASYAHDRFYLSIGIAPGHDYKLRSFTGAIQSAGVKLNWQTDNESNFTYFIVEKSTDNGKSFIAVDSLRSTGEGSYNYMDIAPGSGSITYRLKQKLVTDAIQYSNNLTFNYLTTSNLRFVVYPSTTSQNINVNFGKTYSNAVKVSIVSSTGGLVKTTTVTNTDTLQQNVANLLKGLYVIDAIDLATGKKIGSGKFFKQ